MTQNKRYLPCIVYLRSGNTILPLTKYGIPLLGFKNNDFYLIAKEKPRKGDIIHTTNIQFEIVKEVHDNYSTQPGYEYLVTVEGSGNQYKPVEIFGTVIATTDKKLNTLGMGDKDINIILEKHKEGALGFINVRTYNYDEESKKDKPISVLTSSDNTVVISHKTLHNEEQVIEILSDYIFHKMNIVDPSEVDSMIEKATKEATEWIESNY